MAELLAGGAHHPLGVQDVVQGPVAPVHARPLVVALHGIILLHGKLGSGWAVNVRNIFGSPFGAAESYAQRSSFILHRRSGSHRLDTTWTQPTPSKGYERDEMTPSIEAARKIAKILGTTVGYLLDETEQENLFKDPDMLKRLNEIEKMDKEDKNHILYAIDGLIRSVKLKNIAAQ